MNNRIKNLNQRLRAGMGMPQPRARSTRGMTLVELMIAMSIFIMLAVIMLTMVTWTIKMWSKSERRRVLYERAGGAIERIADDLTLVVGREPAGVNLVRVRFIGDLDPKTGHQRLMFVRSFESGPERALTNTAGDGRRNELKIRLPDSDEPLMRMPGPKGPVDQDSFTGKRVGDYRALGGMAQIAYFEQNQILYKAIRAPAEGSFLKMLDPKVATPVISDCLYLAFDYWSQHSSTWDVMPSKSKIKGPEKVWDSTRGITAEPLNKFIMHRGPESLADPTDDVFPRKIKITLGVDSPLPKCIHTKLIDTLNESDGMIYVDSTEGFPKGGTDRSYILIEKEWIHYKKKKPNAFVADIRGARGTYRDDHDEDKVVRVGRLFTRTVFIPNFREDFTPSEVYYQRIENAKEANAGE